MDDGIQTKYGMSIDQETFEGYCERMKNQIFKLLPLREENGQWEKHLETLLVELSGADSLFADTINFTTLLAKLEALKQKQPQRIHRKTVLECVHMIDRLTEGDVNDRQDNK